ncbi:hypothetical protein ACFCY9_21365 [Streptomyces fimicarius]
MAANVEKLNLVAELAGYGEPKVSLGYQANVWNCYNWDENKGVSARQAGA